MYFTHSHAINIVFLFRWVSAHRTVLIKALYNYHALVPFFAYVQQNQALFGKGAVEQAKDLEDFLKAKNAPLFLVYALDTMDGFHTVNMLYQRHDQSSKYIEYIAAWVLKLVCKIVCICDSLSLRSWLQMYFES